MPRSTMCTSIDGLWILTILLIRPGTAWLMLYCSGSRIRSILRKGEPGGYSGTTMPPGRIGDGAYGPPVAGPGFGTVRGAGSGGRFPCAAAVTDSNSGPRAATVILAFMQ